MLPQLQKTAVSKDSQVIKESPKDYCSKMAKHHKSNKGNAENWVKENQATRWERQPKQAA